MTAPNAECNEVEVCDGTSARCPPDKHRGSDGGNTCPSTTDPPSAFFARTSSPEFAAFVVGMALAAVILVTVACVCVKRHRARKSETADLSVKQRGAVELGLNASSSAQHVPADTTA